MIHFTGDIGSNRMKVFDITSGFLEEITDPDIIETVFEVAVDRSTLMPDNWTIELLDNGPIQFQPVEVDIQGRLFVLDNWESVRLKAAAVKANNQQLQQSKLADSLVVSHFLSPKSNSKLEENEESGRNTITWITKESLL